MQHFDDVLTRASQLIGPEYFLLKVAGGRPVPRERVYCYELYHQLRCFWPENCPYLINGEVDKAAHPILSPRGIGRSKPDLLVHIPGVMKGNFAVIEIKCTHARGRAMQKDKATLDSFVQQAGYQRAIYLFYGPDYGGTLALRIRSCAATARNRSNVEVWHQDAPLAPAIKRWDLRGLDVIEAP